ncbi:hypothetical protein JXL19_01495 [bacterium]|nr:hypothetical protein [bacterium]
MWIRVGKLACGLTIFSLLSSFICLVGLMMICPAISGEGAPAVRRLMTGAGLYLDNQPAGSCGSTVQFALDIINAPNDIESFGLDIEFDPNVLEPKKLNPGDPNSWALEFTRGAYFEDPNWYFDVAYKPEGNYIRVGGFTAYKKVLQGATCPVLILNFIILRSSCTTNLKITRAVDDIEGWPAHDGMLYASYYYDGDGDGYGDPNYIIDSVILPPDYSIQSGDCDDMDPNIYPGAIEICDGRDNDCDGTVDNEGAQGCTIYYRDHDGDIYGQDLDWRCLCAPEGEYTALLAGDCDDNDPERFPGNLEVCDGRDNDCDGIVDNEGAQGCVRYYLDEDNDGYGLVDDWKCMCDPNGRYAAIKPGDCDDSDPNIRPGAPDTCGDGTDHNCDGIDECASLTALIKDPNQPMLNMIQEGVILNIYQTYPDDTFIVSIDDPNMLERDPVSFEYSYFINNLNPGIYEMRAKNIDPNKLESWKYQPMKKAMTLNPGWNTKEVSLVRITGTQPPRIIKVALNTAADNVRMILKGLFMEQGKERERHVDAVDLSKADPNQPFLHDFIVFQDTNYRIYAQSSGYRGVSQRFPVVKDITDVDITLDNPSSYSVSIIKEDIDDGKMALNFFYRDQKGEQGEWVDVNNNFVKQLSLRFFDAGDDADSDGSPDDPNVPPGGPYITHADEGMEVIKNPEHLNMSTILRYTLDAAINHMSFNPPGDPNCYIVAFLMDLAGVNNEPLLGHIYHRFTVEQRLSPIEIRSIAEVTDTLVGSEVLSKGKIPVKGDIYIDGEARHLYVNFDASEIDPTFLEYVDPNGKGIQTVDPDCRLDLKIGYLSDSDNPVAAVVRINMIDPSGNPVEYNPDRNPDAPAIVFDIPIASCLQPPVAFSDAVSRAVIKFERFGMTEIFMPQDGENIGFYISSGGIYMARVITKHTSDWSTAIAPVTPSNFWVTVGDNAVGSGEVKVSWDPNSNKGLDIKCNRIYYSASPDINLDETAFVSVDAGAGLYIMSGLTDQRLYYFLIVAEDQLGKLSGTSDIFIAIPGVEYKTGTIHSGIYIKDYRIITFPVSPFVNDPADPNNILDDLGEPDREEWRLFWWDPDGQDQWKYCEFPDIGNIAPCKAFFLITRKEKAEIDIPGRPVQTPYSVVITEDWNLIGSPYPFDVSWQEILDDPNNGEIITNLYCGDPDAPGVPTLYAFDPNASDPNMPYMYETGVMEAGTGYWLKNNGQPARLYFKPDPCPFSTDSSRYRPVTSSAETPPGLPVSPESEATEDESRKGGCFVSEFGKDGHLTSAIFRLFLFIAGILAIASIGVFIVSMFRIGGKCRRLIIFLACLGLGLLVSGGLCDAEGKTVTYLEAKEMLKSGEYEKAEAGFRRVLEIYPKHAYAQKDLGLTLVFLKRYDDAAEELKKAVRLSPKTKLSLEALNVLGILETKKQGFLKQDLSMKYSYDDNVDLFPVLEDDPSGKSDSYYSLRYMPKVIWPFPAMKGLNLVSLQYMYDTRFYEDEEDNDLRVQMLAASWTYFLRTSRIGLIAIYNDVTRNHDHYGYGNDIKLKWTYDIDFCMRLELTGGYGRRAYVFDRNIDKEYTNGEARLRFYSPNRAGYIELAYSVTEEDLIKDELAIAYKDDTTVGNIEECSFRFFIPKSFILPLNLFFPQRDWSSFKDTHTLSLRKKRYEWYRIVDLGGRRRDDRTFAYRFKHKQGLFKKEKNGRKYLVIDMILEYIYKQNDSNIDEITTALDSKDYHQNIYSIGIAFKF